MSKMIKTILSGVAMGFSIFVVIGVIFDIMFKGNLVFGEWSFSKMALASFATGIGFSAPAAIYESTRLPQAAKILIHLGIGFTVMFASSIFAGWIPVEAGLSICLISAGGAAVTALIIWLCFYLYNKKLAEKMNKTIKESEKAEKAK